jgi:hypothetical protein
VQETPGVHPSKRNDGSLKQEKVMAAKKAKKQVKSPKSASARASAPVKKSAAHKSGRGR